MDRLPTKPNDFGIDFRGPDDPTDIVVPYPPEFKEAELEKIRLYRQALGTGGFLDAPQFATSSTHPTMLKIAGTVRTLYPTPLKIDTQIILPDLDSPSIVIERLDTVSLVAFVYQANLEHDPDLAVNFNYMQKETGQILPHTGQLAGRQRGGWVLVLSSSATLTKEAFVKGLFLKQSGDTFVEVFDVVNTDDTGFLTQNNLRFYSKDPNLTKGKKYPVFVDFMEITPVCNIRRIQNIEKSGYTYGYGGEEPFSVEFVVEKIAPIISRKSIDVRMRERLLTEVFAGIPGRSACMQRSVQNFAAGAIAGNPGVAGVAAASPNGSVCLAMGRISFSNQSIRTSQYAAYLTASNDGSGNALISMALNGPDGSFFSDRKEEHRIFTTSGIEDSASGTFSNLGGTGFLTWIGGSNSIVKPGSLCYMMPTICYPSGSGFSVPFDRVEKVWISEQRGVPALMSPGNIRSGELGSGNRADVSVYQAPEGGERTIVVFGKERAALHYAFEKITVTADTSGVVAIPPGKQGCFAFIEGVTLPAASAADPYRIDQPVVEGLVPGNKYNALIYRVPQSTENWQFQFAYCQYQGVGAKYPGWLDGATVTSNPLCFIHTQGGGGSVFRGEGNLAFSIIAMHLPEANAVLPAYCFDSHLTLLGETYNGPRTFREILPITGANLALPAPGQKLTLTLGAINQARSLSASISTAGVTLGFRTPVLDTRSPFQGVLAFAVEKEGRELQVIATYNSVGGVDVPLSSDFGTGIDLFEF